MLTCAAQGARHSVDLVLLSASPIGAGRELYLFTGFPICAVSRRRAPSSSPAPCERSSEPAFPLVYEPKSGQVVGIVNSVFVKGAERITYLRQLLEHRH